MSDRRLRQLEREASSGEPLAIIRWADWLVKTGDAGKARALLHPLVKRTPDARPLFVSVMVPDTKAFCGMCGKAFTLNAEGFPLSDKPTASGSLPKKRRTAKKKKRCYPCTQRAETVRRHIVNRTRTPSSWSSMPLPSPPKDKYCGVCGALMESTSHRCDVTLPEWLSGGKAIVIEYSADKQEPHWSDWRNVK